MAFSHLPLQGKHTLGEQEGNRISNGYCESLGNVLQWGMVRGGQIKGKS